MMLMRKTLSTLLLVIMTLLASVCFAEITNFEQGVINTTQLIKNDPNNVKAYVARSYFNLKLGKMDEAFADADKAIKMNTDMALAYWVRSSIYLSEKNDAKKALADINKAMVLEPNNPHLYVVRGRTNFAMRDFNAALNDYNTAIKLDKHLANAYFFRGAVRFQLGDRKGSGEDYIKASDLEPGNKLYADYKRVFGKHAKG